MFSFCTGTVTGQYMGLNMVQGQLAGAVLTPSEKFLLPEIASECYQVKAVLHYLSEQDLSKIHLLK